MESIAGFMPWVLGGLIVVIALAALQKPLKWLAKLLARTAVSLGALFAFSQVGGLIGVSLGVNLVNALVIALLGVPGFGLLLLLNWTLH